MRLLLDTSVLVKWIAGSPLPRAAERLIARRDSECLVSIVTGWEIVMKPKLGLGAAEVDASIAALGAMLLPIRFSHLDQLSRLPFQGDHRDPFDRLLVAQACRRSVDRQRRCPVRRI